MNHINSCPRKETCLHYYKELLNNNSLQGHHWNTQNADDKTIKMHEQKEALKITKNGNSPGEDNLNSELYTRTYAGEMFNERLLFFLM